ncbi:MAG: Crp/Fnr family transcriptional regulator [Salinivirgaceae bacterium]|nr:Crp/Fnr family transcriptional regulator [Salinivirgaceae bacterium]
MDRHQFSKFSNWFDSLTEEQWKKLSSNTVCITYNKGETICKQGSFANTIFFVAKGVQKIYKEYHGQNLIVKFSQKGEMVGLSSMYNSNIQQYTVASVCESVLYAFNVDIVKEIIRANADFAEHIISCLNAEQEEIMERTLSLTQKQLHGRLADAVIYLARRIYRSDNFTLQVTRRDMADFCGTSTESAIRILKEFHDDKIIQVEGKHLKIISNELLERLSEIG